MKTDDAMAEMLLEEIWKFDTIIKRLESEPLNWVLGNLTTLLLNMLGVPEDDWDPYNEEGFCRDWWYHRISDGKAEGDAVRIVRELKIADGDAEGRLTDEQGAEVTSGRDRDIEGSSSGEAGEGPEQEGE